MSEICELDGLPMKSNQSRTEWILLILVSLLAIATNLPETLVADWHIDRRYLLTALVFTVVVALLRYLKFVLFLVVTVMAVGANVPAELAVKLGYDRTMLLVSMCFMVAVSALSYLNKWLPTGLPAAPKEEGAYDRKVLCNAIARGKIPLVQKLLKMGINVNIMDDHMTPLMHAAKSGYADMVQLLLQHGADPRMTNREGRTALQLALDGGYTRTAQVLQGVSNAL
jgi:uncharacterized protein